MGDKVELEITVDDKGSIVIKNFRETVGKALADIPAQTKKTGSAMSSLWKEVAVGVGVANLAQTSAQFLIGSTKRMFTSAMEAEVVESKRNSTLRAYGESVQVVGKIQDEYATQMQALTGIEDEQISSLMDLGRNLGIHKELLRGATEGAVGLVKIYGGSMPSAMEAVANAYKGHWMMMEKIIPELKDMTNESDKLAYMQQKMAEGFQASTDAMKGSAGQIITIKNQWNDFLEGTGKGLLVLFAALKKGSDAMSGNSFLTEKLRGQYLENQAAIEKLKKTHLTYAQVIADEGQKQKLWDDVEQGVIKTKKEIAEIIAKDKTAAMGKANEIALQAQAKAEAELTKKREEAAAIVEKYGLNIQGFNEAGREQYFQLMQAVGILPQFTSETQAAADAQAHLGTDTGVLTEAGREMYVQMLRMVGILPTLRDGTKETAGTMVTSWQEVNAVLEMIGNSITSIDKMFSALGVDSTGVTSQISNALGAVASFGAGLEKISNANEPGGKGFLDTMAGVTSIVGAVTAVITVAIAVVKLFAGDGIGEAIKREQVLIGVNKELIKQIKDLAKTMGDTHAATSVMLNDVIDQANVTVANFDTYAARIEEILSDYDRHALSLGDTTKEIGDSFTSLIAKAKELGTEGSASMLKLMDDLNSRGIKVKEIQDYIAANWKMGLEGYKKYLEGDFSKATIGVFEYLLSYEKKVGANQALVDGVKGITLALISMSNVTKLTEEEFGQFELAASDAFKKLTDSKNKNHFSEKEALMQLQPMLSRMIFLNKEYGLGIDAATQALIDKAKAAGIDLSLVKTQEELMGEMAGLMKELVDLFKNAFPHAVDDSIEALKKFNRTPVDDKTPTFPGQPNPKNPPNWEPAAEGMHRWVTGPTRIIAGEGNEPEYIDITPQSKLGSWASPRSGSDSPATNGSSGGGSKTWNLTFHIPAADSPEQAADNLKYAIYNNVHGVKSLLEEL